MSDSILDESPVRDQHESAMAFVLARRRLRIASLAVTALAGGLAEALFLVVVTRAAFAITSDDDTVGLVAGWSVTLPGALGICLALVAARFALAALASYQSALLGTGVMADIRRRLARSFFDASWETQQRQRSGTLQELLTTFGQKTSALMSALNQLVFSAASLASMLALAIAVDPLGALVLVITVGLFGMLLRPLRKAIKRRSRANSDAGMELATALSEVSELGLELHVFNAQDAAYERVDSHIERSRTTGVTTQIMSGLATPIYTAIAYLAIVGALAVVSASDSTDLASLGAVMLVMLRSLSYGQALQNALANLAVLTPPIEELQRQLDIFSVGRARQGARAFETMRSIRLDNVHFSYAAGQPVLHGITLSIEPGEVIGIVGPSGGGKSTLVQLLLGLREPELGSITVGDVPIGELDRQEWARRVTFVPQEPRLITGTVADNIRFLRDDVSDEQVRRAAIAAHIDDEILRMPGGYDRQLGVDGDRLSGGQQQRICIARALAKDPELVVLDEPTSALDVRSEHLIRTTLLSMKGRRTVVIIAHRLSTLDICDRIMVIQNGRLVAFDTPERLQEHSDFYRDALTLSGLVPGD